MYAIEVQTTFCASHALRLPPAPGQSVGGLEPLHGHNFTATVRIAADELDALETVLDFHLVEAALDQIIAPWKNRNLNDIEPFKTSLNPSAERIVEVLSHQLMSILHSVPGGSARNLRLVEARLTEAPNCLAIYRP